MACAGDIVFYCSKRIKNKREKKSVWLEQWLTKGNYQRGNECL